MLRISSDPNIASMASSQTEDRAIQLAERAQQLVDTGDGKQATRALREALSLAPENVQIQTIAKSIHEDESLQPLLKLCREFSIDHNSKAGDEVISLLSSSAAKSVPGDVAGAALRVVIAANNAASTARDDIVAVLLQNCLGARQYVAQQLARSVSVFFSTLFEIGDGSANGITVVSLDTIAWTSEEVRRRCEQDVFLLFQAKLLESGHDNDGRALKGIARHLAVDAPRLHNQVDEQSFDAILVCLDYRLSEEVRGQATLATAKFLEASEKTGQEYLTRFIAMRTAKHGTEDLVLAFSVAAAVFPIATQLCSTLFLVEGFLPSLIPLLDKKSRPIKVEKAALDMLNAACIDAGCRAAIAKYCWEWMHHVMEDEEDERHGQAALILAKVQSQPTEAAEDGKMMVRRPSKEIADVVPKLKEMVMDGSEIDLRTGIEGLAYASVQAIVKENIINDGDLLKKLFRLPKKDSVPPTAAFGYLTLVDNLTRYLPILSEEQRKMSELRAYANASKPQSQPNPLDEDGEVTRRCTKCLDAHLISFLVTLKSASVTAPLSPTCLEVMAKIILSMAKHNAHRGRLVQQGAIPLLLQIYTHERISETAKETAAHALARTLISIDPALIPGYTNACIRPLLSLLHQSTNFTSDQPRNLLPAFESLLALTNLVSDPKLPTGPTVVASAYGKIEDLLLSNNTLVQRAATELICNLANSTPEGLGKLADGSTEAARRINILVALSDAEDVSTRRAASGALAGALDYPGAVDALLKREGGVNRLLSLCEDEDAGCVMRGIVCVRSLMSCPGPEGYKAREAVRACGGKEALSKLLKKTKDYQVIEHAADALKLVTSPG